jgi:peptidoglycan/LPS O-acetylase OafA/YrhL
LWSYSIYLSHKAVAHIAQDKLDALGLPGWMTPVFIGLACVLAGWLLYRCIEVPFMSLRERHVPGLFARTPSGGASLQAIPGGR